jgi:hypothetical protein
MIEYILGFVFLAGLLTAFYLAGRLILEIIRLFSSGRVATVLWFVAVLCALVGVAILTFDDKTFFGIASLGVIYLVIKGFWVLLHRLTNTPLDDPSTDVPVTVVPVNDHSYYCGGSCHGVHGCSYNVCRNESYDDWVFDPAYRGVIGNVFHRDE